MNRSIVAIFSLIAVLAPLAAAPAISSLADLIQAGNVDAARERIRAGADVNQAQPDGTRPIQWAVYRVNYELVKELIAKKAQVNVKNAFGSTPIAEAAKLGDTQMVKLLLDGGANPEGANADGQTALMLAVSLGHLPVVKMLMDAGANVNTVEHFHNQTALMWASGAPKNAAEIVKLLLAKGADVKPHALYSDWGSQISSEPRAQYRATGGLTALLYAARDGCYFCVDALVKAGADVNDPTPEGVSPLMLALDNEHNEVAKLLLDHGADPNVWDWWGRTPLYIAVDRKAILEVGAADVFGVIQKSKPPAAPSAGVAAVTHLDIINALLAADVDPNIQLNMHRPSRSGNSGRFIDPLLSTGCTPLLRAAMVDDNVVMQALLAKGAAPNIVGMGITPFLETAGVGTGVRFDANRAPNLKGMEMMLQHGADINAQVTGTATYSMRISRAPATNEGMTALHVAAQRGDLELVRFLMAHGANPELRDGNGKRPVELLSPSGDRPAVTAAEAGVSGAVAKRTVSTETIAAIRTLLAKPQVRK